MTDGAARPSASPRWATATPISAEMEEIRLRYWLSKTREYLTVDHPRGEGACWAAKARKPWPIA